MTPEFTIAGRRIGAAHSPYIICELSGNHNGSLDRALALVDAAADTGCDAIKLQTYTADTITLKSDRPEFQLTGGMWKGYSLYDLYAEAHTPWDWHPALFERAAKRGVTMFSSPFDDTAVDFLNDLGAPAFKIASFELVDLPLVAYAASKGKPLIMSTGMANLEEIHAAVETARKFGTGEIVLLHCVSEYPANIHDANVRVVPDLGAKFGVPSGLSDHTFGTAASVASVALGGCVIEKHFTLARADGGPDSGFSLEPAEFTALVNDCKDAWAALGQIHYDTLGSERGSKQFRRSLYVVEDIKAGEPFTKANVKSIRPGLGLPPVRLWDVLDKTASRDIARGEPLRDDMIG
ncbi:pseudaminic acid synthase [Asticcacaulis sp. BYS171W]|uniref:Pseudaminic acid synthase n=1 Tax=Asticcacaulis aquaticus TaxID=2984212 RepID=A0ABT5HRL6_9CAUL|nr:pseudaminic acid synthase [Asticcacaulis aquaticus]